MKDVDKMKWVFVYNQVSDDAYNTAKKNGWRSGFFENLRNLVLKPNRDAEFIALLQSEASEALEAMRAPENAESKKIAGFSCVEEELSDIIIRIMDYGVARRLRIASAVLAKMEYNKSRPYRHGGKKF